jgi:cobalt-zinc-cadmium efflux system membrane fusion protein
MKHSFQILMAVIALLLVLCGCQSRTESVASASSPPAVNASKPDTQTKAGAETVEVDPAMLANIQTELVRQQALPRVLTATGKVQFNEDQTARVLAPLPGQVMDLRVRVGDAVAKDQALFSIKSRDIAALVADYLQGQRDQDLAEKTYAMTKDLFEHQAASRISFQQAESDVAKAKAQVTRAEEALRIYGLDPKEAAQAGGAGALVPVRSSLSGTVIERTVTPGQFVQADSTALITIADLSTVWVLVDVFEQDLHLVRVGQRVNVAATAYPDRRFTAQVDRISDRVDPETRTLKVRLLVSNPGLLLKPEMFITASLVLNESTPGVTVPATAVFTEGERSYLFVALGGQRFERRLVTAAPDGAGRLRVTGGVRGGDRVVTDGALLLRFRQKQQQQPE